MKTQIKSIYGVLFRVRQTRKFSKGTLILACPEPTLSGANLSGEPTCPSQPVQSQPRSGADLSRANLSGSQPVGANLGANLSRPVRSQPVRSSNCPEPDLELQRANCPEPTWPEPTVREPTCPNQPVQSQPVGANPGGSQPVREPNPSRADLWSQPVRGGKLSGAKEADIIAQTRILPDGDIIGWKMMCQKNVLVTHDF